MKLTNQIVGMKNQALNCLTISTLNWMMCFQTCFENLCVPSTHSFSVDKRCKAYVKEIQAAFDGVICHEQATKLKICLDFIDEQQKHIDELDSEIFRLAELYAAVLDLIGTIPGLSSL